jgi:hypothetical protein
VVMQDALHYLERVCILIFMPTFMPSSSSLQDLCLSPCRTLAAAARRRPVKCKAGSRRQKHDLRSVGRDLSILVFTGAAGVCGP